MLLKLVGPYWVAPLFTAILGVMALGIFSLVKTHSYEVSLNVFFCFLPMAFYMAAAAQVASQKQVSDLKRRIERLETQAAH